MGLLDTLAVKISGQARDAVAALDKTAVSAESAAAAEAHLATTSAVLEQAQAKAAVVAAKAAGDTEALAVAQDRLAASNAKVAESKAAEGVAKATVQVKNAQAAMGGLTQETTAAGSAMAGLGALGPAAILAATAAAGVELGKTVLSDAHSFANATTEVQKFKNTSGATSEQASVLRAEAHGLGVDMDALATGVYRMSKNIDTTPQKFRELGIEIAHNKNGTVDLVGTLSNASDAYNATNDQLQKNAIVQAVAGRAGQQIIPILKAGGDTLAYFKDQADRRGEIFSDQQVQKGIELQIAFTEVKTASEALSTSIGEKAAPEVTRLELGISDLIDKANQAAQALPEIGKKGLGAAPQAAAFAVPIIGPPIALAVKSLEDLGKGHEKAAKAAAQHQAAVDALAAEQQQATAESEAYTAALEQETSAALGIVNADEAVTAAQDGVAAAHKAVDDAQKQVAQHAIDLARANRDAASATRAVGDAEDKLAEARRQAPRDLIKAKEDEAAAVHSIADAEDELSVSIAKYGVQSRQAADAQDKLNKAKESQADAADKLSQLQKDPNKSIKDAEDALATARDRATDAHQRAIDLAKQDPTQAIADATKGLTQAEDAYRDALLRQAEQRKKLNDDLTAGKVNASDLADALQNDIDLLKAAGVDPSVLKGLENLRIFVGGQAPPGAASTGTGAVGSIIRGTPAPAQATGPGAVGSVLTGGTPPTITNNWFIQNPVDPQGTADAITWQQRSRGLS